MKKAFVVVIVIALAIGGYFYYSRFMAKSPTKTEAFSVVTINTDKGAIKVKLYNDTPLHKANFLKLAGEGYYDGILFHRVIPGFMVQAGDPDSKTAAPGAYIGSGGPGYTVPAEILPQHIHKRGALSAARQPDQVNPERASSGSQFYIVQNGPVPEEMLKQVAQVNGVSYSDAQMQTYLTQGGYPTLDGAYTVFGEVIEGMDVVDTIAFVSRNMNDRPIEDIKITGTVIEK